MVRSTRDQPADAHRSPGLPLVAMNDRRDTTRASGGAPRGLGVDEDTVRSWQERGLIRAEVLPGRLRRVASGGVVAHGGTLTGFPEPLEEDLPPVHVQEFGDD